MSSKPNSTPVDPEAARRGHEVRTIPALPVLIATAAFFGLLVVSMFAMSWLFGAFEGLDDRGSAPPMAAERQVPPAPRLQLDGQLELEEHRERMDEVLGEYAWIDRGHGVVRLPVDRAMELIAERGLPHRGEEPAEESAQQPAQQPAQEQEQGR